MIIVEEVRRTVRIIEKLWTYRN